MSPPGTAGGTGAGTTVGGVTIGVVGVGFDGEAGVVGLAGDGALGLSLPPPPQAASERERRSTALNVVFISDRDRLYAEYLRGIRDRSRIPDAARQCLRS